MRWFCRRYHLTSFRHDVNCRYTIMTQNAIESSFGARVKQARDEAGMTIAALAKELGVDPRTVAGWQANRSRPSYERLAVLARVTGKAPSFFLEDAA